MVWGIWGTVEAGLRRLRRLGAGEIKNWGADGNGVNVVGGEILGWRSRGQKRMYLGRAKRLPKADVASGSHL